MWTSWRRPTVRRMMIAVVVVALALAYVASYYRLSRRGMREARDYGIDGFLYVPCSEADATGDLGRHYAIAAFYAPLNWIDRSLFGAPTPWLTIMSRLSR